MKPIIHCLLWASILLPGLISAQVPNAFDHPQTTLNHLQQLFTEAKNKKDYPEMLTLMDKMLDVRRSIDYQSRASVVEEYRGYAPLFQATAEGRFVYNLYLFTLTKQNLSALLAEKEEALNLPADKYAKFFTLPSDVAPCKNLYELGLLTVVYKDPSQGAIRQELLEMERQGRGNVPANFIYARIDAMKYAQTSTASRLEVLDSLIAAYPNHESVTLAYLNKVYLMMNNASQNPQTRDLCKKVIRQFPKSTRKPSFKSIIKSLEASHLYAECKEQVYPGQTFPISISHTNIERLTARFYTIKGRRVSSTGFTALKSPLGIAVRDTLQLTAPSAGKYILKIKSGKQEQTLHIYSGRGATLYRERQGKATVYATDMDSGFPLSNVTAFVNSSLPTATEMVLDGFTAVTLNEAQLNDLKKMRVSLRLGHYSNKDNLLDTFSRPIYINYLTYRNFSPTSSLITRSQIYTDRKLYQSGDSLHFKGIVSRYQNGEVHTVEGLAQTVILQSSSSNDTLGIVQCTTNAYGSFSGSFATTSAMMNGTYVISTPLASTWVRVETYQRPGFYVEMPENDKAWAFGDEITQDAQVMNYAGFPLEGARVNYTVYRRPLIRPYLRWSNQFIKEEQVAEGSTTTNAQGAFQVSFPAQRPAIESKVLCSFTILVTVTDSTGETHQKECIIPVGDVSTVFQASLTNKKGAYQDALLVREHLPNISIKALNLSNNIIDYDGQYTLTKEGKEVFKGTFNREQTQQPDWEKCSSGTYVLHYGDDEEMTFRLISLNDTNVPENNSLFFYPLNNGQTAFLLGTSEDSMYVLAEFFEAERLLLQQHIVLEKEMRLFDFPIIYACKNPVDLRLTSVKKGNVYTHSYRYEKKQDASLEMQLETFHPTALPNSKEEMSLKIASKAEVLVSIYNASTDRLEENSLFYIRPYPGWPMVRHIEYHFTDPVSHEMERNAIMYMSGSSAPTLYKTSSRADVLAEDALDEQVMAEAAPAADQEDAADNELRTNFSETLAFLPHLMPDDKGIVQIPFRTNGLLSTFRVRILAHDRTGRSATATQDFVVRKEVMILPSLPAFLREGDRIQWQAKAVNLTDEALQATAELFVGEQSLGKQELALKSGGTQSLSWEYTAAKASPIDVTAELQSQKHKDATRERIDVLSGKTPITRAQTRILQGNGVLTLVQKNRNSQTHFEVTTPASAALYALPALCNPTANHMGAWLSAYYANLTGAWLMQKYPYLQTEIERHPLGDAQRMEENSAITGVRLQETPWADFGKDQKRRMDLLAQLAKPEHIAFFREQALQQFETLQQADGGFSWFPGMESSYYMTLLFLEKMGQLQTMGVNTADQDFLRPMIEKAIAFTDNIFGERFDKKTRSVLEKDASMTLPYSVGEYFFVRSAFLDIPYTENASEAIQWFMSKLPTAWSRQSVMEKAQWAIIYQRMNMDDALQKVRASLKEFAVFSPTLGCYFPNAVSYTSLFQSSIQANALLLQIFHDDPTLRRGLRQWLLLQKENHIWGSYESTTDVIYALLQNDDQGSLSTPDYQITQKGTTFTVRNRSNTLLFASLYEQTLEETKQMESSANELEVTRQFYLLKGKDNYIPLEPGASLLPGDVVAIRYQIHNTQNRSFVHLRVPRAACLSVQEEASLYQWNATCSYYREVEASQSHYYFENLNKGDHVIEERFFVTQSGDFDSGFAQIQCLYAPQYRGFSSGGVLHIQKR